MVFLSRKRAEAVWLDIFFSSVLIFLFSLVLLLNKQKLVAYEMIQVIVGSKFGF